MTKYQPSEAQAKEAILLTLLHKANWQFPCIPQLLQRWLLLWHISHLLLIGTRTRSSRSALCILALNHRHILLQKRMGTFFLPWNCCFSSKSKLLQGFAFWWKWQMLFFHKWHKEGLVLLVILKKKKTHKHCWKKITLQHAVQFLSGQMLITHSTSHGTIMTGHVLQWTDPPRGFHHTLIIFPGVSCFITVCCHTPQPTSWVTQIVLTSYSLGFFNKKLIHHLCNGRGNIYISYGCCNSWGFYLRKKV